MRSLGTPCLIFAACALAIAVRPAVADQLAYITGGADIWTWDTTTNSVSVLTNPGIGGLDSIIFDAQGNIVVNSFSNSLVDRYNLTTGVNTPVTGSFVGPADMALEPGGTSLLISNAADGSIARVNLTTSSEVGSLNVGLRPDGLAYDNAGHLFAVLGLNSVAQIDPLTGAIIKTIATPLAPDGLTFDATTGKLYVASDDGGFYVVPTDLSSATFVPVAGSPVFDGIASSGNDLYFAVRGTGGMLTDTSGTILEISPGIPGADDIAPVAGLGSPTSVPEPPSLALFGSAVLGFWLVQRRKRRSVETGMSAG